MASRDKARKFFAVANYKQYAELSARQATAKLRAEKEKQGQNTDLEKVCAALEKIYSNLVMDLLEIFEIYFADKFTDEELDDLISLYSAPVFQKMLFLMPDMFAQMEKWLPSIEEKLEKEIEALI